MSMLSHLWHLWRHSKTNCVYCLHVSRTYLPTLEEWQEGLWIHYIGTAWVAFSLALLYSHR